MGKETRMINPSTIDDIIGKLKESRNSGIQLRLSGYEQSVLLELLENTKNGASTVYELTDRDACPVIYMDIAGCYPTKDVRDKIGQLIRDEADTDAIRHELASAFGAREISPEHIILPHIE